MKIEMGKKALASLMKRLKAFGSEAFFVMGAEGELVARSHSPWLQYAEIVGGVNVVEPPAEYGPYAVGISGVLDALQGLEGVITLSIDGTVSIGTGNSSIVRPRSYSDGPPPVRREDSEFIAGLPYSSLKFAMDKALPCASNDKSRPTLTHVEIKPGHGVWKFASTDGFRLAMVEVENKSCDGGGAFLLDKPHLKKLLSVFGRDDVLTVSRTPSDTMPYITFENGKGRWAAVMPLDARFPDYMAIVPDTTRSRLVLDIPLPAFREVCSMIAMTSPNSLLRMTVNGPFNGTVTAHITSARHGRIHPAYEVDLDTWVVADRESEPKVEYAFSASLMGEFLKTVEGDTVSVHFQSEGRPIRATQLGYTFVMMPMFLQREEKTHDRLTS